MVAPLDFETVDVRPSWVRVQCLDPHRGKQTLAIEKRIEGTIFAVEVELSMTADGHDEGVANGAARSRGRTNPAQSIDYSFTHVFMYGPSWNSAL
jgi:hypothetical protein